LDIPLFTTNFGKEIIMFIPKTPFFFAVEFIFGSVMRMLDYNLNFIGTIIFS